AALREVRAARRTLDHLAGGALSEATLLPEVPGRALDCVRLCTHPGPVVRHALRQAWKETGATVGLKTSVLDRLVHLAQGSEVGSLALPQGWRAQRDAVTLRIGPGRSG